MRRNIFEALRGPTGAQVDDGELWRKAPPGDQDTATVSSLKPSDTYSLESDSSTRAPAGALVKERPGSRIGSGIKRLLRAIRGLLRRLKIGRKKKEKRTKEKEKENSAAQDKPDKPVKAKNEKRGGGKLLKGSMELPVSDKSRYSYQNDTVLTKPQMESLGEKKKKSAIAKELLLLFAKFTCAYDRILMFLRPQPPTLRSLQKHSLISSPPKRLWCHSEAHRRPCPTAKSRCRRLGISRTSTF